MKRLLHEAKAGKADAQFNLGVFYNNRLDDNGHAIAGNRAEAIKWLLAAARQGLPRAQMRLAETYVDRPDTSGSHAKAFLWFLLAKASLEGVHREKARSECDRLAAELTPEQMARGVKLARLWKPRPYAGNRTPRPRRAVDAGGMSDE